MNLLFCVCQRSHKLNTILEEKKQVQEAKLGLVDEYFHFKLCLCHKIFRLALCRLSAALLLCLIYPWSHNGLTQLLRGPVIVTAEKWVNKIRNREDDKAAYWTPWISAICGFKTWMNACEEHTLETRPALRQWATLWRWEEHWENPKTKHKT